MSDACWPLEADNLNLKLSCQTKHCVIQSVLFKTGKCNTESCVLSKLIEALLQCK